MRGSAVIEAGKINLSRFLSHIGAENNGYFPLIDFQQGENVVSLKSVNTTGVSWMGRMQSTIDQLGSSGITVNGQPANIMLDLRVQPGGAAAAAPLIDYGAANGVSVNIGELP